MEQPLITCPRCSAQARDNARFCPACGNPLQVRPPPAPTLQNDASRRPLPKMLGPYQVRGVWENDAVTRTLTNNHSTDTFLALPLLQPLSEERVRELVSLVPAEDAEIQKSFARVVEQIHDKRGHYYLIVLAPRGRRLDSLPIPIAGERALEIFFQMQDILRHMQSGGLVTALPPPPQEKLLKNLPFAQWLGKMSDEVYVRFQRESLERFRRCFALEGDTVQLFDYTGWEPGPPETKERLARIQRDQILAVRTMHWLYANASLGRNFNLIKTRGGDASQIILDAFANLTNSPQQTGELLFSKTKKLHDTRRQGTLTRSLSPMGGGGQPTAKLVFQLDAAGLTDAGKTREHNEDSILFLPFGNAAGLYVVADGLGGHADGQMASETVVKSVEQSARAVWEHISQADGATIQETLKQWILTANQRVLEAAYARGSNMGSTITAALIVNNTAFIANVGDSRTYLVRNKELAPITRDHSLVASLVAANLLNEDEIYTHPQRNQIFRSLGAEVQVNVDVFEQALIPHDKLLLCSDGLWEMIRKPQLESLVNEPNTPSSLCQKLVAIANNNGGEDNISVIVICVE